MKSYFIERKTVVGKAWTKVQPAEPVPTAAHVKLSVVVESDPDLVLPGEPGLCCSVSGGSRPDQRSGVPVPHPG